MSALPAQPNHSLIEGIDVLFAVASRSEPVKVRELARELGYTPTRMQRYLATLASLGLCHRNEDRSYQVGPGIHALLAIGLSASGLTQRAVKVLREFGEANYIIALGILWREPLARRVKLGRPSHRFLEKLSTSKNRLKRSHQ